MLNFPPHRPPSIDLCSSLESAFKYFKVECYTKKRRGMKCSSSEGTQVSSTIVCMYVYACECAWLCECVCVCVFETIFYYVVFFKFISLCSEEGTSSSYLITSHILSTTHYSLSPYLSFSAISHSWWRWWGLWGSEINAAIFLQRHSQFVSLQKQWSFECHQIP